MILQGRPRLRQLRAQQVDCNILSKYSSIEGACFGGEDATSYGPGEIWRWISEYNLDGTSYWGYTNPIYPGSGFVINFPSPRSATATTDLSNLINLLQSNNSIDMATRVVFAEMVFYDSDDNFFEVVTVTFEFPLAGGSHPILLSLSIGTLQIF